MKNKWFIYFFLLLGVGITFYSSDIVQSRVEKAWGELEQFSDHTTSIGHRLYNYTTTLNMIIQKPILGYGTGSYREVVCKTHNVERCMDFNWHPHNQYLFFWFENGLLGLLAFLYFSTCLLLYMYKQKKYDILVIGFTAIFLVNALFNSALWNASQSHFFTMMYALLAAGFMTRNNNSHQKTNMNSSLIV